MASDELIEQYLGQVASGARGLDSVLERLLPEAAEHITDRIAEYLRDGIDLATAQHRALSDFGDPAVIASDAASALAGGTMRVRMRRIAALVGLLGATVLLVAHIAPSTSIAGTGLEAVAVIAMVITAMAAMTLLATMRRRAVRVVASLVAAVVLFAATWAMSTSGLASLRDPWWAGNMGYVGIVVVAGVAAGAIAWRAGWLCSSAAASLAAGYAGLILNSAWESVAAIGDVQGNLAVALIVVGWALTAIATWSQSVSALHIRVRFSQLLIGLGEKVEPKQSPKST